MLLSLEVTDDLTHTSAVVFEDFVDAADLEKCLADGAHSTEASFKYHMADRGLDPLGIKARENVAPVAFWCGRSPSIESIGWRVPDV